MMIAEYVIQETCAEFIHLQSSIHIIYNTIYSIYRSESNYVKWKCITFEIAIQFLILQVPAAVIYSTSW